MNFPPFSTLSTRHDIDTTIDVSIGTNKDAITLTGDVSIGTNKDVITSTGDLHSKSNFWMGRAFGAGQSHQT